MESSSSLSFFQSETKFVVGAAYKMIRVSTDYMNPAHNKPTSVSWDDWIKICDTVGDVLPDPPIFLGVYVRSKHSGTGDGRTRHDYFVRDGAEVVNELRYDGTTRYCVAN